MIRMSLTFLHFIAATFAVTLTVETFFGVLPPSPAKLGRQTEVLVGSCCWAEAAEAEVSAAVSARARLIL